MKNITFIGLGNMGGPMAANLLNANFSVTVFDLNKEAVASLTAVGATAADSARRAVEGADTVITMLPAAKHVESVYFDQNHGIADGLGTDTLVIDCSTIDADTARSVGNRLSQKGVGFIDAPVSGGVGGAKAGTLTFIMGGAEQDVDRARPVLSAMGKNLFHAGDLGSGQIAKICNNMLLAVLMAGTSEALQLAIHNGLDPKVMSEIMKQSSGNNWALQLYNPCPGVMDTVPSSNDYEGGFMVKLMNKDLGLAAEAAQGSGSATPMASLAQSLYKMHQNQGYAEKDFSSIFRLFDQNN
ncbi:3-hydroxyisobutyrate dehydrogenase [Alteromonas sediminis]|uniref:3-hydroxyisobutyrate dehydrogenase n=1 Tax=Alteromonas sediminis TaxID=2259342 RepID=A0A3N5Y8R6_9ALTE|nr:3-hydroxyisobutyrate dehydrogenase [Alteromonas sediminis]RPJ67549.1 3-hydroxyisobutyrate dehydrogenase [Alteromonas sediminis]